MIAAPFSPIMTVGAWVLPLMSLAVGSDGGAGHVFALDKAGEAGRGEDLAAALEAFDRELPVVRVTEEARVDRGGIERVRAERRVIWPMLFGRRLQVLMVTPWPGSRWWPWSLFTSRLNAGIPTAGTGYQLNAIAARVIGGASLLGAKGGAFGAAAGALIVGTLNNGGNLLAIN